MTEKTRFNKTLFLTITGSLSILILIISLISSYAYFTAQITGSETNTSITISGGVMTIAYANQSRTITLANVSKLL